MPNTETIVKLVTILADTFGRKVSDPMLDGYVLSLSDIESERLMAVLPALLRSCKFMPSPAEIRDILGVGGKAITADDKPTLAWEAVRRAIQRVGSYDSPDFDDKLINAAIRSMGGWVALCDTPPDEMVWREKVFRTNYLSLSKCDLPDEQTVRLAGISEKENGPVIPVRVAQVGCLSTGSSGVARIQEEPKVKRIAGPSVVAAESLSQRLGIADDDRPTRAKEHAPPVPKEDQLAGLRLLGMKGTNHVEC